MNTLIQLQLIVDSGLLILIWLVQIIIYPSFHYIDTREFKNWHMLYTRAISTIVVPLMLIQSGLELYYALFEALRWWRLLLITAVFLSTFILSVPCHRSLQDTGKNTAVIHRGSTVIGKRYQTYNAISNSYQHRKKWCSA